jgi:hypothetical protein
MGQVEEKYAHCRTNRHETLTLVRHKKGGNVLTNLINVRSAWGTAHPWASNELGPLSSPDSSVVVAVAVAAELGSREGNEEEEGDGGE